MNCPICKTETREVWIGAMSGKFDYCPTCKEDVLVLKKRITPDLEQPGNELLGLASKMIEFARQAPFAHCWTSTLNTKLEEFWRTYGQAPDAITLNRAADEHIPKSVMRFNGVKIFRPIHGDSEYCSLICGPYPTGRRVKFKIYGGTDDQS